MSFSARWSRRSSSVLRQKMTAHKKGSRELERYATQNHIEFFRKLLGPCPTQMQSYDGFESMDFSSV
jgi:hypothetical protein